MKISSEESVIKLTTSVSEVNQKYSRCMIRENQTKEPLIYI